MLAEQARLTEGMLNTIPGISCAVINSGTFAFPRIELPDGAREAAEVNPVNPDCSGVTSDCPSPGMTSDPVPTGHEPATGYFLQPSTADGYRLPTGSRWGLRSAGRALALQVMSNRCPLGQEMSPYAHHTRISHSNFHIDSLTGPWSAALDVLEFLPYPPTPSWAGHSDSHYTWGNHAHSRSL